MKQLIKEQLTTERLEIELLQFIKSKGRKGATFYEIESHLRKIGYDYKGHKRIGSNEADKIVFWGDWNDELSAVILRLLNQCYVTLERVDANKSPKKHGSSMYGIAKRYADRKTHGWFPVVLVDGVYSMDIEDLK